MITCFENIARETDLVAPVNTTLRLNMSQKFFWNLGYSIYLQT